MAKLAVTFDKNYDLVSREKGEGSRDLEYPIVLSESDVDQLNIPEDQVQQTTTLKSINDNIYLGYHGLSKEGLLCVKQAFCASLFDAFSKMH